MMAMTTSKGKVVGCNSNGLRLEGESAWRNYSRFANPTMLAGVHVGQTVTITLDTGGFIRAVAPAAEADLEPDDPPFPTDDDAPFEVVDRTTEPEPTPAPTPRPEKEVVVTRLAVINSAISLLCSGNRQTGVDQVLQVAAQLESWATLFEIINAEEEAHNHEMWGRRDELLKLLPNHAAAVECVFGGDPLSISEAARHMKCVLPPIARE